MHNVLEFLEDIELDAPNIWRYFAETIGIPAADGYLPMKILSDCANMMHQKLSACKMLKEVLVKVVNCSVSSKGDGIDPFCCRYLPFTGITHVMTLFCKIIAS